MQRGVTDVRYGRSSTRQPAVRRGGPDPLHRAGGGDGRGSDDGLDERRGRGADAGDGARDLLVALAQGFWVKGESSGHVQELVELRVDCDRDCLLALVRQTGPACHTNRRVCFYTAVRDGQEVELMSPEA
jgi:hypothetical protein